MQLAAAAVAVLLPAIVVLRAVATADRRPHRAAGTKASPQRSSEVAARSTEARGVLPPAPGPRSPAGSAPARSAPAPLSAAGVAARTEPPPDVTTSVLGAFRETEVDRRPRAGRRAMSALLLALVTLSIATGVAIVIYLGLGRLG